MPVTLDGVGHAWPGRPPLFTGVSRSFEPGRVCALVGPSGSGKSTLLAVLAGMLEPTAGTVHRAATERVLWVFQNPYGVVRRTVLDHVALPFLARGADRRSADRSAGELLQRFGLAARASAPFAELSGGEAQRLVLARGIAAEPTLMLVDEPTAQLDRATADEVNRTIGELAGTGAAVVVATHDADTRAACDDVLDLGDHQVEQSTEHEDQAEHQDQAEHDDRAEHVDRAEHEDQAEHDHRADLDDDRRRPRRRRGRR